MDFLFLKFFLQQGYVLFVTFICILPWIVAAIFIESAECMGSCYCEWYWGLFNKRRAAWGNQWHCMTTRKLKATVDTFEVNSGLIVNSRNCYRPVKYTVIYLI